MNDIKQIVKQFFGKNVQQVKALAGELDQNFQVECEAGKKYLLKIAHEDHDSSHLEMENQAMLYLAKKSAIGIQLPAPILNVDRSYISQKNGKHIRLINWIEGKLLNHAKPHSPKLLRQLGEALGKLHKGLAGFDHPSMHRKFDWDPAQFDWVKSEAKAIFSDVTKLEKIHRVTQIWNEKTANGLDHLPQASCYLDANDYNVIVSAERNNLHKDEIQIEHLNISGFIDFGDITYTHRINELAVCLAYACMEKNDPIEAALPVIRGFNSIVPLGEEEIAFLYTGILSRLAISVSFSEKRKSSVGENPYLNISEQPAWDLIDKLLAIHPRIAEVCFRNACGFEPAPNTKKVVEWITDNNHSFHSLCGKDKSTHPITVFDWSVGSRALGNVDEFDHVERSTFDVFQQMRNEGTDIGVGRYNEPRPVYTTMEYARKANDGPEWRTIHLGIDLFLPAGSPLFAPLSGEVVICWDDAGDKEYGPLLVLKHTPTDQICFYTLYGHNDPELISRLNVGDVVQAGDRIALIGDYPENGNWVPHVHFQVMTELFGYTQDFPGVAYPSWRKEWLSICPDPNLMLGLKHDHLEYPINQTDVLLKKRAKYIGPNLSVSYSQPLHIKRGYMQYLYEESGRRYLDTVNNVPHVGHQHPRIVQVAQQQTAVLNTNTRYLNAGMIDYAEALLAKLPDHLDVIYFVNSGSEANELALRLASSFSEKNGVIALDHGYHGNTGNLVGLSAYKCNGPGGFGLHDHAALMPVPDPLRNKIEVDYAQQLDQIDKSFAKKSILPGTLIHETILSCGGQLVMPDAFFLSLYQKAKKDGIVTIADEVQTGFGRVGEHFWSFQYYDIAPDIVTMGKPIGNGHPLGAVATTREIANKFHNGMEYFATFGGNPVSCAIGHEVLKVIDEGQLQDHAHKMGQYLKMKFMALQEQFPVIAEVRGYGLFLGIELVQDRALNHAAEKATYLTNRMKDKGILMSSDGPHHNVIKIKPPLCFSFEDADFMLAMFQEVLEEDFMLLSQ